VFLASSATSKKNRCTLSAPRRFCTSRQCMSLCWTAAHTASVWEI
jgi:hypothetical protein